MQPVQIIFFDIDGTLIDMNRKQITPRTLEALTGPAEKRGAHLRRHRPLAHAGAPPARRVVRRVPDL